MHPTDLFAEASQLGKERAQNLIADRDWRFNGSLIVNLFGWRPSPRRVRLINALDHEGIGSDANMIGYTYSAEYLGVNHKFDMIADDRILVMGLRNHHSRRDAAVVAYACVRIGDDPFAVPMVRPLPKTLRQISVQKESCTRLQRDHQYTYSSLWIIDLLRLL